MVKAVKIAVYALPCILTPGCTPINSTITAPEDRELAHPTLAVDHLDPTSVHHQSALPPYAGPSALLCHTYCTRCCAACIDRTRPNKRLARRLAYTLLPSFDLSVVLSRMHRLWQSLRWKRKTGVRLGVWLHSILNSTKLSACHGQTGSSPGEAFRKPAWLIGNE